MKLSLPLTPASNVIALSPITVQAGSIGSTLAVVYAENIRKHYAMLTPVDSRMVACLIAFEDRIAPSTIGEDGIRSPDI